MTLTEKLRFVYNDAVVLFRFFKGQFFDENAGCREAGARRHDAFAIAVIQFGLYQESGLSTLGIVILDHDRIGGFGGAHRSVAEVKLCHTYTSFWPMRGRFMYYFYYSMQP